MCKIENLFNLNNSENKSYSNIEDKYEQIILQPYYYIKDKIGDNTFVHNIIKVYGRLMKLDQVDFEFYSKFVAPMYAILLIMDDILDSSDIRWGIPTPHTIYGVGRTASMMDYIINTEFSKMYNKSNKVGIIIEKNFKKQFEGEIMEVYWRDNFICPSEDEYFDMVSKKTGQFFFTMGTYMEVFGKANVVLGLNKLSLILGIYYQISDDYLGLTSKVYCKSKGFCDDIREGKFIFPIIHAIQSRPNDTRILDILKMRTNDVDVKMKCLNLLQEFGSMEYTSDKLKFLKGLIVKEIEKLGFKENYKMLFDVEMLHQTLQDH